MTVAELKAAIKDLPDHYMATVWYQHPDYAKGHYDPVEEISVDDYYMAVRID